jgi:protocatechuate 3,4-dioxygenase, beta subunit
VEKIVSKDPIPHPSTFAPKKRLELINGYKVHESRTPGRPVGVLTPSQTIGPFFPKALIREGDNNLACLKLDGPRAQGTPIEVRGTIRDDKGQPVAGALIEVWQANKWGKYEHPVDVTAAPLDPHFKGYGRVLTDRTGTFSFRSIKPGAYPNPGYDNWYRPPHIHFSIFAAGVMSRLVTQMYFPNEELNDIDPILNGVEDLEARSSLIARQLPSSASNELSYEFNIVLRGASETPFSVDP